MEKIAHISKASCIYLLQPLINYVHSVKVISSITQFYMTLYAISSSEISSVIIVDIGVVTFIFNTLEVLIDMAFSL